MHLHVQLKPYPAEPWAVGLRIHVRPLLEADIGPHYAAWFSDPAVRQFIKFARTEPTLDDLKKYRHTMATNLGVDFLGLFDNKDGRHIGNMKFETGPLPDEMHVGFLVGDPAWRQAGILSEILAPCVARVRRVRGLRRVYLTVDPANTAAIRAFTKLGFESAGVINRLGALEMDYAKGCEASPLDGHGLRESLT